MSDMITKPFNPDPLFSTLLKGLPCKHGEPAGRVAMNGRCLRSTAPWTFRLHKAVQCWSREFASCKTITDNGSTAHPVDVIALARFSLPLRMNPPSTPAGLSPIPGASGGCAVRPSRAA